MSKSINDATKRGYDGTVARVAGNIAAGLVQLPDFRRTNGALDTHAVIVHAVQFARFIVAETKRTEPVEDPQP